MNGKGIYLSDWTLPHVSADPQLSLYIKSEILECCLEIFGAWAGLADWWNEYPGARLSRLTLGSLKEFPNDCICTFFFFFL